MDFGEKNKIVVICGKGLGKYVQGELSELGFGVGEVKDTSVHTQGSLNEAVRLNLELRTGLYVHYLLGEFKCRDSDELYRQVKKMAWEDIIPDDEYISIVSRVDTPSVNNTMYPSLKVKDAICDKMSQKRGKRPNSGPERDNIVLNLYWKDDSCWLYLNTSGNKLSDRNYRKMPFSAPLQETLAAAVLRAAGYDGSQPLVLPMCGSGTLAIEAAMMGLNRAAGMLRDNYCFKHVKGFDESYYKDLRAQLRKKAGGELKPIIANDISPKAIEAAKSNAKTAGVDNLIEFSVCDFAQTPIPNDSGIVLMNPEYGMRLGEVKQLEETYQRIGDFFKQRCEGYTGYVFTGNPGLSKKIGLRTKSRKIFFNAKIECRLLEYEMYAGSKKQ